MSAIWLSSSTVNRLGNAGALLRSNGRRLAMTSHELACKLLDGPDMPVTIDVYDGHVQLIADVDTVLVEKGHNHIRLGGYREFRLDNMDRVIKIVNYSGIPLRIVNW